MERLLLIDGNSFIYRGFFATSGKMKPNSKGEYTNAVEAFDKMLLKAVRDLHPDYIAVALDKEKHTFRKQIYPEYKNGRAEPPEELRGQFSMIRKYLDSCGIMYFDDERYEADDIIGTIALKYFMDICIFTGDHDLLQLISDFTTVYITKKGVSETEMFDRTHFREKYYGLEPENIVDIKSLAGDKSDSIPGVKGIGEKNAVKLIQKYGGHDGLLKLENGDDRYSKLVIENKEQMKLSYLLAKIKTDIPLEKDVRSSTFRPDPVGRSKFMTEHEM